MNTPARARLKVLLAEIKRHFAEGTTPPESLFEEAFNITNNRAMIKEELRQWIIDFAKSPAYPEVIEAIDARIESYTAAVEAERWKPYPENKPEVGIEVIGYSREWIIEDYNPKGYRLCFWDDAAGWISAKYNNTYDCYETIEGESPEKWRGVGI